MKDLLNQNPKILNITLTIAAIFFLAAHGFSAIDKPSQNQATITVTGSAEISVKPDVATFIITIRESDGDIKIAQQKMAKKANDLTLLLKQKNVPEANIKTSNYSTNPKYSYERKPCVNNICEPTKRVLDGYEASQTITLKSKDFDNLGDILSGVSAMEIYEVRGPNFAVENVEKVRLEIQGKAIENAKEEAKKTAENLGVKLGKITGFFEQPSNINFRGAMAMKAESANIKLAEGEEKISTTVSITYEIK